MRGREVLVRSDQGLTVSSVLALVLSLSFCLKIGEVVLPLHRAVQGGRDGMCHGAVRTEEIRKKAFTFSISHLKNIC